MGSRSAWVSSARGDTSPACVGVCVFCECVCFAFACVAFCVCKACTGFARSCKIYVAVLALPSAAEGGGGKVILRYFPCCVHCGDSSQCHVGSGFVELSRAQFGSLCGFVNLL